MAERKKFLLRVDQQVYDAVQRWADDELRSVNAHIEFLLRRALSQAGRSVRDAPPPRRGRPPVRPEGDGGPPDTPPAPDADADGATAPGDASGTASDGASGGAPRGPSDGTSEPRIE